jgi:hypothetical protein
MSQQRPARFLFATLAALSFLGHADLAGQAGKPSSPDLADLARRGGLHAASRQVAELVDGARRGARLSPGESFDVAWIDGVAFTAGTLEVDVRGKDVQGQSFLGVAFGGANDSTYESVYLRPFNFRATDPLRRAHAIQYESMPTHPWARLRSEFPEVYENPADPPPDPNEWVRLRLVVEPARVRIFVGDGAEPDLVVDRVEARQGARVGLWVGNLSGGDFANLRITPAGGAR